MMMSAFHASLLIFFSIISLFKLSFCIANNTIINFCPEIEKQSLLSFKQSLEADPDGMLSSWDGGVNCCNWNGVICDAFTGHVRQLSLSKPFFELEAGLKGNITSVSGLFNLKHLTYLDLSGHNSLGGTIPSQIGSFPSLQYLNLSDTWFYGKVPHTIGNLSNLHTLHLGSFHYDYPSLLVADSLEWVSGLSRLEYLNMDGVNLKQATNWKQVVTSLPSLLELHFERCSLDFMAPMDEGGVNITISLKHLYLSSNLQYQYTTIPQWIFQLTNLLSLHLSSNHFIGPIPTISNSTKLQHIDLGWNDLNSSIPNWVYFCKDLECVDLGLNKLSGTISNSIANLTSLQSFHVPYNQLSGKIPKEITNLCNIKDLRLSNNKLEGEISELFGKMSECFVDTLETLKLGFNKLSGHLTDQLGEFKRLQDLQLSGNKFSGNFPESLGQLVNLQSLEIANNMLEGVVTQTHFASLTKLEYLYASQNHLTLKVSPNWNPPFQLRRLQFASWTLGSTIPSWLETQKNMVELDLSDTGISGHIPTWAWNIPVLTLSHNHLYGNLQIPSHNLQSKYIYLGSNQFTGSLPLIHDTFYELDLSNNSFSGGFSHFLCDHTYNTYNLQILHVGRNLLSGEIPDCWMKWPFLRYLNLGYNNLSGSIPNSLGYLVNLGSLNLHHNRYSGKIPFSMHNCSALIKMDLSHNNLDGDIPTWVGTSLINLKFLILHSNKLSGNISSEICHLKSLQILDLSGNQVSGMIPRCFYNLTAMATKTSLDRLQFQSFKEGALLVTKGSELLYADTALLLVTNIDLSRNNLCGDIPKELTSLVELRSLNLSHNRFTGPIPDHIGDMKQLESLDFSNNSLSGHIPQSFTLLSFLSCLNLSYNNLMGEIPLSTQLRGMDASSFIGNHLCGHPLTIRCRGEVYGREEEGDEEEGEGESKIEWLYVMLCGGYAVGVSAVCSLLVLNKSWRDAYFGFLQSVWDKIYVCVCIQWNKISGRHED